MPRADSNATHARTSTCSAMCCAMCCALGRAQVAAAPLLTSSAAHRLLPHLLRFAVLALTACGVGLNLACADTAVFAELCWNPSTLEQAEARIHRMGQKASHVSVYYLVGGMEKEDSLDNVMFMALVRKSRAAARAVDGGELPDDLGGVAVHYPQPHSSQPAALSQPPRLSGGDALGGGELGGGSGAATPSVDAPPRWADVAVGNAAGKRRVCEDAGNDVKLRSVRPCVAAGMSAAEPMQLSDSDDDVMDNDVKVATHATSSEVSSGGSSGKANAADKAATEETTPLAAVPVVAAPVVAAPVADDRPLCQYGSKCYRKNPMHLAQYRHDSNSSSNRNIANDTRAVQPRPEAAVGMGTGGLGSRGGRGGGPRVSPYFAAAGTAAAPAAARVAPAAPSGSGGVEQVVDLISDEDEPAVK